MGSVFDKEIFLFELKRDCPAVRLVMQGYVYQREGVFHGGEIIHD